MSDVYKTFKEYLSNLRRILSLVGPYSKYLYFIIFTELIGTLVILFQPVIGQITIDYAILRGDLSLFITLSSFSVIIFILNIFKNTIFQILNDSYDVVVDLKTKNVFFKKILELPQSKIDHYTGGQFYTRLNSDLDAAVDSSVLFFINILTGLFNFIFILIVTSLYSYKITLMALPFIPILCIEAKYFTKEKERLTDEGKLLAERAYNYVKDRFDKLMKVKILCAEERTSSEYLHLCKTIAKMTLKGKYLGLLSLFASRHPLNVWTIVFTLYLGYMVVTKQITFGQMTAIGIYFGLLVGPLISLFRIYPMLKILNISCRRTFEIFDLESESERETAPLKEGNFSLAGDIIIRNLSFSHSNANNLFNNISTTVKYGDKVALIGENGIGKSTLSKLLLKLYPYNSGDIIINNNNLKNIHYKNIRSHIGYLTQEFMLFDDHLNKMNVNNDIFDMSKIKDRVDHRLMSGGEKQKLNIIELLNRGSFDIYIFDEFTNNFDSNSIYRFLKYLDEHLESKTVILISHTNQILRYVDKILLLQNDCIVEYDSYDDCLSSGCLTRKM